MDLLTFILSFALTVCVLWMVIRPFLAPVSSVIAAESNLLGLVAEKDRLLQVLKELELDYATGKLPQADYLNMKAASSQELAVVLERHGK